MPDIWMDVDTAVIVPVNIMPLLDDTDFKTIETAIVYNSAGLVVTWNFVTTAGVVSGTAITPTTAGDYDWSEPIADKGMYAIEIPASAGASANNDTEGFGWITGVATGVLPWRGPVIGFRAAALNNSLIDAGTTGLLAPTVAARTVDVAATGEVGLDFDNIKAATAPTTLTNITVPTVTTTATATALTTNNDKTGYALAAGGVIATAIAAAELNTIADAVLDRILSTGTDSGADNTTARTVRQALRVLRNKVSIAAGTMTVTKEDDSTASFTAAITTTAGNPVSTVDPT